MRPGRMCLCASWCLWSRGPAGSTGPAEAPGLLPVADKRHPGGLAPLVMPFPFWFCWRNKLSAQCAEEPQAAVTSPILGVRTPIHSRELGMCRLLVLWDLAAGFLGNRSGGTQAAAFGVWVVPASGPPARLVAGRGGSGCLCQTHVPAGSGQGEPGRVQLANAGMPCRLRTCR